MCWKPVKYKGYELRVSRWSWDIIHIPQMAAFMGRSVSFDLSLRIKYFTGSVNNKMENHHNGKSR
jgi:hypothetical protein